MDLKDKIIGMALAALIALVGWNLHETWGMKEQVFKLQQGQIVLSKQIKKNSTFVKQKLKQIKKKQNKKVIDKQIKKNNKNKKKKRDNCQISRGKKPLWPLSPISSLYNINCLNSDHYLIFSKRLTPMADSTSCLRGGCIL